MVFIHTLYFGDPVTNYYKFDFGELIFMVHLSLGSLLTYLIP